MVTTVRDNPLLSIGTTFDANSPGWQAAMKVAQDADVIVYVGGINADKLEREENHFEMDGFLGGDRTRIELPEVQENFVEARGALHKPVVFVNCSGSAMALKWETVNLPAIVQAWYPGENGGTAVGEVLFGDVNPSGHLPITFYAGTDDLPAFIDYSMANRTYRYFSGQPLFAFGHGLSYTKFDFGAARLSATTLGADGTIHLSVPVTNAGPREAMKSCRSTSSSRPRANRNWCGAWRRSSVFPCRRAAPSMPRSTWPRINCATGTSRPMRTRWAPGSYEVEIGAASNDIRQKQQIIVAAK